MDPPRETQGKRIKSAKILFFEKTGINIRDLLK
jgi:hypothetical protein